VVSFLPCNVIRANFEPLRLRKVMRMNSRPYLAHDISGVGDMALSWNALLLHVGDSWSLAPWLGQLTLKLFDTDRFVRRGVTPADRYTMTEQLVWWLLFASAITGIVAGIVPFSQLLLVALILLSLIVIRHRRRIYIAIIMLPRDFRWASNTKLLFCLLFCPEGLVKTANSGFLCDQKYSSPTPFYK
jgi:hypothetical protein